MVKLKLPFHITFHFDLLVLKVKSKNPVVVLFRYLWRLVLFEPIFFFYQSDNISLMKGTTRLHYRAWKLANSKWDNCYKYTHKCMFENWTHILMIFRYWHCTIVGMHSDLCTWANAWPFVFVFVFVKWFFLPSVAWLVQWMSMMLQVFVPNEFLGDLLGFAKDLEVHPQRKKKINSKFFLLVCSNHMGPTGLQYDS